MTTHFSTVPIDRVPRQALGATRDWLRPLALVVEDDPILATTFAAILNSNGLAALSATNPFSALETAAVIPPEILIADFKLPGMSGLDLVSHITEAVPDCDAILFSGQLSGTSLLPRLRALGHRFSVLYKPVHPADLLNTVFEILSRRGHPIPRPVRRSGITDPFSSTRRDQDPIFGACMVSNRRRASRQNTNPV